MLFVGEITKRLYVLILVLVEDGLRGYFYLWLNKQTPRLNPCFSGGWSQSYNANCKPCNRVPVLILVLVEDGLRALLKNANLQA